MNKPLTKKEWQESVANAWRTAIEATYRDMIEKAVAAEREACAKVCDDMWTGYGDLGAICAAAIRARGQA